MELLIDQLAGSSGLYIYLIAFGILLACGFGFPLPEDVVLFSLGYLSYTGEVELITSIVVAMAGVLIGDSTIYLIGRTLGQRTLKLPGFRHLLTERRLEHVRRAFYKNGSVYLFFARFTPGLRSVTFWSAGLFHIPFRTFFLFDGLAAVLSVPLFTWVGYFLGETFHTRINDVRDAFAAIGVIGLGVIVLYTYKYVRRRRAEAEAAGGSGDRPRAEDDSA